MTKLCESATKPWGTWRVVSRDFQQGLELWLLNVSQDVILITHGMFSYLLGAWHKTLPIYNGRSREEVLEQLGSRKMRAGRDAHSKINQRARQGEEENIGISGSLKTSACGLNHTPLTTCLGNKAVLESIYIIPAYLVSGHCMLQLQCSVIRRYPVSPQAISCNLLVLKHTHTH